MLGTLGLILRNIDALSGPSCESITGVRAVIQCTVMSVC
jgi:hypothetical protein